MRTLRLLLFLSLLIALPLILNAPQKQQNLKQHAQPPTTFPVYGIDANVLDGLANSWTAHTTYGTPTAYDDVNKSPIQKGVNSIRYTVTAPFDGFDLTAPNSFDISPYNYLSLYAQAGEVGQKFNIVLIDTNGNPYGSPVEISPAPNYWSVYNIPVSQFGITDKTILGIGLHDSNGGAQPSQPPAYFDEINFSTDPAPPPDANPTNIVPPPSTEEAPYYPDINPWIFIIPAIIVLLAVVIF